MRIAIYGTGGVGGYFGGRLAQSGQTVIFIARGVHRAAIAANGLRVESIDGDFSVKPAVVYEDPALAGQVDVVILATKTWQVTEAAQQMKSLLGENTCVLPLENGVDSLEQLERALGPGRVLGGMCRISSFVAAPGLIRHVGVRPHIAFGELDNRRSPRVLALLEAFSSVPEIKAEIPDDIECTMWEKFVFISAVSGVGSITRQPMGGMRTVPETRAMLMGALEETASVGRARGVALPEDTAGRIMKANVDGVDPGTVPSMERDVLEGRPTELESMSGAVVRMGRQAGVPTPTHEFLYAALLPLEIEARQRGV